MFIVQGKINNHCVWTKIDSMHIVCNKIGMQKIFIQGTLHIFGATDFNNRTYCIFFKFDR